MSDIELAPVKFLLVMAVGLIIVARISRKLTRFERRVASASVLLHGGAAIAEELVFRYAYGGGDMFVYQAYGELLSRYISMNSASHFEQVVALLFQQDAELPFGVLGEGSSTGSMCALAGLLSFAFSNSLTVIGACIGSASAIGMLLMYRLVRPELPAHLRNRLCLVFLLLPSVVFWSSALLKESVIMLPIAWAMLGIHHLVSKRYLRGAIYLAVGTLTVALFKPYIVAGIFLGIPAYLVSSIAQRRGVQLRITWKNSLATVLMSVVSLTLFSQLFEQFDVTELGEQLAAQQRATLSVAGTSTYQLVGEGNETLGGQLLFAPQAIITAFFRPFLFEAHNLQSLANAVESTVILIAFAALLFRHRSKVPIRRIVDNPTTFLFAVYVFALALGVGLATTNMGALSRYRIPMYAHFALLIALMSARKTEAERE